MTRVSLKTLKLIRPEFRREEGEKQMDDGLTDQRKKIHKEMDMQMEKQRMEKLRTEALRG